MLQTTDMTVSQIADLVGFGSTSYGKIRTNNAIERIMKEIRRRTRVVGSFPDGNSALMLVCDRLRHITTATGARNAI